MAGTDDGEADGPAIRDARVDDVPAIRDVAVAAWHAAHDHILGEDGVDEVVEDWYAPADLREQVAREEGHFLLASSDDVEGGEPAVLGFAHATATDEDGWGDAHLARIYVRPAHWGEGVGSALLERACDRLRADGHERLQLAVLADNEVARRFYEARGFDVVEERTVELAGQDVEDLVMGLEL